MAWYNRVTLRRRTVPVLPLAVVLLAACTGDDIAGPPEELASACEDPLEVELGDGSCIRPGILPGGCAAGFVHDGEYGCEPVLPAEPCPPGLMAVPGDEACRSVQPCGAGRWGDIPVGPETQYVDGSYDGGQSDGSEGRPWTTIGEAVAAAPPAGLIAIARGTYNEDVVVASKPVRLWGVCADEVQIVATGQDPSGPCPPTAACISNGAHGTELRSVGLTGATIGVLVAAADDVLLDKVHVHDTGAQGVDVEKVYGSGSLTLRDSLVEQSQLLGVYVAGASATIERSVVRATRPSATQAFGRGINVEGDCSETPSGAVCDPGARASAVVRGSLIAGNHEYGIYAAGSDLIVEASVVRGTLPRGSDQTFGHGIAILVPCLNTPTGQSCDGSQRGTAVVRGSLVEDNHELGLFVMGSDATVEASVIRATHPRPSDQVAGRGLLVQLACIDTPSGRVCDPATRARAAVRRMLIEDNHDVGIFVAGSDATVEASVVRATAARASDGLFGDGVAIYSEFAPASASLTGVLIEESARAGLSSFGSSVTLGSTRIRCAAFELSAESLAGHDSYLDDRGDNLCGCPTAESDCRAISVGLEPPEPY